MIKIFNDNLEYIGLLDIFDSFQCSLKYADAGSFTIKALLTDQTRNLLVIGNFVLYNDFCGRIDSVTFGADDDGLETIKASGDDLNGLLSTRIDKYATHANGAKVETFLRNRITANAIVDTYGDTKRVIPFLEMGTNHGLTETTDKETDHESLLELAVDLCDDADYGFKITFDPYNKKLIFEVYEGEDKSSYAVIGREYDNVYTQDYTASDKDAYDTCYVNASYTNSDNSKTSIWKIIGGTKSGFDRHETFLESALSQEDLTLAQYTSAVVAEGKRKIVKQVSVFDVDTVNIDYSVGDKLSVIDKAWNIKKQERITEKQIAIQDGKITTTFLLGKDV